MIHINQKDIEKALADSGFTNEQIDYLLLETLTEEMKKEGYLETCSKELVEKMYNSEVFQKYLKENKS